MSNNYIRDPLYTFIEISNKERKVLDTEPVQRLRRVTQQSTTSFVYPSATHTRFAHSLGVMHIGGKMAQSIGFSEEEVKTVRLAGLLHDIGHGPFSHTSDKVAKQFGYWHEKRSCELIDSIEDTIPQDTERIKKYIKGNARVNLISGDIDADRMDYLNRDSLFSGLEHGTIDIGTLINFADVIDNKLVFSRKCIESLKELLTARMHMEASTFQHHGARVAERMIMKALKAYVEENSVKSMMEKDDYQMHSNLLSMEREESDLYKRVSMRNLYKRSYTIRGRNKNNKEKLENIKSENVEELEREIAESAGFSNLDVIISKPNIPQEQELDVNVLEDGSVKKLSEISEIPDSLQKERWKSVRFDVYSPEDKTNIVKEASQDTLKRF